MPKGMREVSEMLASLREDSISERETHPIDPLAQAMELRDRFRRARLSTPFEPGMLCREKRGLGMLKRGPLVMFWRWLDPADPQDATRIERISEAVSGDKTDCLIGFLDDDGNLVLMINESWRLERCDEFPE